jgi:DNA mismatch repair protein MutL
MLHGPASTGKFTFERLARIIASKAQRLLEEMFECDLPYCAADGRPTLTEYNRKDIDRRFGVGRG